MNLVMTYTVGDGCSWSADETIPFEYDSVEKAEYDFLRLCELTKKNNENKKWIIHVGWSANEYFYFCGKEFSYLDYFQLKYDDSIKKEDDREKWIYYPPTFQTLEEWFQTNRIMEIN